TNLNPRELGFQKSFDVVIMVVLGGMGSVSGAVVAAVLLTILPELLREVSGYRMIAYAFLLIVMMILRPQGIFGVRELWELGGEKKSLTRSSTGGSCPSRPAASRRSRTSRWRAHPATSRGSSARTAPARRPCSTCSPACTGRRPAASSSPAAR